MGEDGKGRKAGLIVSISVSQTCMRVGAQWGIAHADIPMYFTRTLQGRTY